MMTTMLDLSFVLIHPQTIRFDSIEMRSIRVLAHEIAVIAQPQCCCSQRSKYKITLGTTTTNHHQCRGPHQQFNTLSAKKTQKTVPIVCSKRSKCVDKLNLFKFIYLFHLMIYNLYVAEHANVNPHAIKWRLLFRLIVVFLVVVLVVVCVLLPVFSVYKRTAKNNNKNKRQRN